MVFSSTIFLFAFLPVTLIGYYLIRKELHNTFLLIMSLAFYAVGEPKFVFIMVASILVNYCMGLLFYCIQNSSLILKRLCLILALVSNLGLLFYNKYFDFTVTNINMLFGTDIPLRNIVLPIGISFFTFQGMSYALDVYMGKTAVQKNPLHVALYIALFPQLIAGPIVRYSDINEQIISRRETLDDFAFGVQRFSVGLAKKMVLSNSFAILADRTFGSAPEALGAGFAWLGALAYTMQIYFDFSGYSDMAIGLGKMFGFHFLENFNYPYIAISVQDFWRRWHISLSTWFRDYVYIPLGGNRTGNVYLHLFIVFLLTGLWHGASWNFVLWGLWHGSFLIIERLLRGRKIKIAVPNIFKWMYTMFVVVIGWVLFRAADLISALNYMRCMFGLSGAGYVNLWYLIQDYAVMFLVGAICILPITSGYKRWRDTYVVGQAAGKILEPVVCAILLILGVAYTVSSAYNPFIYFNF